MNPMTPRHLGVIAIAVLALAGCDRHASDQTTSTGGSSRDSTVAGSGQGGTTGGAGTGSAATGAPGMSGSPPTATPSGAANVDPNALPPTAAGSAPATADAGGTTQTLNAGDRKFVTEAAGGGLFEVQVSQLAAGKATDPAVKQFAQMLVTDHTNANDELKAFASAHNVTLPADLPKNLKSEMDKLQKASGSDFDKQYVQAVGLKDHKEDIAKFEKASQDVKNPQLKAWVDKTLPTLKEHLAAAQKLPQAGAKTASQ